MKKMFLVFLLLMPNLTHSMDLFQDLQEKQEPRWVQIVEGTAQIMYGCTILAITSPIWVPVLICDHYQQKWEAQAQEKKRKELSKQIQIQEKKLRIFEAVETNNIKHLKEWLQQCTAQVYDEQGNTPLHIAAQMGNKEIFSILYQANPGLLKIENKEGKTPFEVAVDNGQQCIVAMLYYSLPDNRSWLSKLSDAIFKKLGIGKDIQPVSVGKTITYPRHMHAHLIPGSPESEYFRSNRRLNPPTEEQIIASKRQQLELIKTGRLTGLGNQL